MMDTDIRRKPLVLMILDGWGYRPAGDNNAIVMGRTPCWDRLWASAQRTLIATSGEAVGLPAGQMGNSEVGHMNIGAGRIVYQDFTRIGNAIEDGGFFENPALCDAIDAATGKGGTVHIMGLASPGGVHSHDDQFLATIQLAAQRGATSIAVHAFLDGRDTPPRSAKDSLERMQQLVDSIPGARIRSICGRYYAMDRDKRWDRVEKAYRMLALADADLHAASAVQALEQAYERGENDEFVQPTLVGDSAAMSDGDSILFINFRADRARELTMAFVEEDFSGFERADLKLSAFVCMTEYMAGLPVSIAFPPESLPRLMGQELASHGFSQLRIAETEKYAHVTFFFNGGEETPFDGEERILISSPDVATYDLQPEMSAPELTEKLVAAIESDAFDVIICNVANPDMVGHTGKLDAAIQAVEAVDACLEAVVAAVDRAGGELLITADHGNVEQMKDETTGQNHTAHTTNAVPFVHYGRPATVASEGSLRDIAPTMLYLLGLPQPAEMTGRSMVTLGAGNG